MSVQTIRDGRLLAFETCEFDELRVEVAVLPPVDELPLGTLDRPWTEVCEGCLGTSHAMRCDGATCADVVLAGPCPDCWGTGRVLFAFADGMKRGLRAVLVPPAVAAPYVHAMLGGES